jgi:hypothetical protein
MAEMTAVWTVAVTIGGAIAAVYLSEFGWCLWQMIARYPGPQNEVFFGNLSLGG